VINASCLNFHFYTLVGPKTLGKTDIIRAWPQHIFFENVLEHIFH
jgi:hypothetical protein